VTSPHVYRRATGRSAIGKTPPMYLAFNAAIREIEGSQMDEAFEHLRKLSGAPDPIRF